MSDLEERAHQRGIMMRMRERIAALEAERDALLEALKQIAYRTGDIALPEAVVQETMRGLWEVATTAIAKAEGREA